MTAISRIRKSGQLGLAAMALAASLSLGSAQASSSGTEQTGRETNQPIISAAPETRSGILSWVESLLPGGMRFLGPAIGSQNHSEVLATATCYDSGAGVSCNGFRSMREYLAAMHASQNLGIPFERLKERMQSGKTLHQAISELRPTVNARIETMKAEQQAEKTLRESS